MPTKAPRSDHALSRKFGDLTLARTEDNQIQFTAESWRDPDDCTTALLDVAEALEAMQFLRKLLGLAPETPDVEPGKDLFSTILRAKVYEAAEKVPNKRSVNIWFSEQIGVHPGAVSHYMQGARRPDPEVYQQILKVLDWPAEEALAALLAMEIQRTKANVRRVYGESRP